MRLRLLLLAIIGLHEVVGDSLRRRERRLDSFFDGASISGSYSYQIQAQQVGPGPPTSPNTSAPSPYVSPVVPTTPLTAAPSAFIAPVGTVAVPATPVPSAPSITPPTVAASSPPRLPSPPPVTAPSPFIPPTGMATGLPTITKGSSKGDVLASKLLKGTKLPKLPKTKSPLPENFIPIISKAPIYPPDLSTKGPKSYKGEPSLPPALPVVPPPNSSKDSAPPKGVSKDGPGGPTESFEYEFEGSLARSLPIAAFLYVTASSERPSKGDYSELVAQTELLFNSLYRAQYEGKPGVEFLGVTIEEYGILATRLIKYSVDVQFREDKVIPSMFEIQSIVQDGLNSSGEYINFYLELLREMDSSVFSTTTAVRFISNAEALIAAQEQAQQDDGSNLNAAAIAVPAVVGALMIAATLYYLYLQQKRKNRTLIMEEGDAIEVKHESLNGDDTMEDSTYFGRSRSQDDGDSSCASSSYDEIEIVEDSEFEEITIDGEDEVDLKNQVGEIKKSYIATNIAEIKIRKDPPVQGSSESSADTPIQAYAVPSQSILNPLGHPFSSNITKLSGTGAALPVISGSSVQVVSSGSSRPTSPTPIWSNPNLRPVKPKEEQGQDIRELARKCDDDRSVITIDSQASSTPEFLKKFKQMGLSANPRSLREPERHPMLEDEQSILTIDSQASSTPEFLKKFKEMGLKRYKS